ncbi:N-acylethanolamine-hydrolyzing acid amidase-like [Mya arenaria]|uniref:N-acylethanolamine-hydrolyzing acid amidase-like n=1 Tax=Mya arenaria TaxID=6604 RepID=UPI0022DEC7AE|nr:N-acylethanolamine-hydrolyzing acid amidase-like [Mya arenaria]XP_052811051.1 N-acylethanolamine-hydrolyzing acid amidase-like [Mya arenaria]XP_052811053.1 N-acylethanolamine-hydrolyzing acid amidase-like [Mya arenaria]
MGSCVMHGLFAAVVLAVWMAAGEAVTPPRKYVVNLDLPPTKRWQEVALDHKQIVPDVHKVLLEYVPEELVPYIDLIATDLDAYIDQPYADEMRGIANVLNVSLGEILLINVIYDLTAYCTSIVSQDQAGMIWHSRNLDYSFTDMLKNITIQVDYQRGGQTAYSSITYAGYVGILTGQRPNVFTVTVDERDQGIPLWNLIVALFDSDVVPVSFLVRDALDADKTFENAVSRFAYTPTAADAYFILAGVNKDEGAVVTKGRLAADDIWRLNSTNNRWYLVETNYDHWKPPPQADDRRDPAIKAMNAMGRPNISVQNLFNVMSTPPVLNKGTTYTVVMSAAKPSLMQAWIRD